MTQTYKVFYPDRIEEFDTWHEARQAPIGTYLLWNDISWIRMVPDTTYGFNWSTIQLEDVPKELRLRALLT